jgi:hypothetical protein
MLAVDIHWSGMRPSRGRFLLAFAPRSRSWAGPHWLPLGSRRTTTRPGQVFTVRRPPLEHCAACLSARVCRAGPLVAEPSCGAFLLLVLLISAQLAGVRSRISATRWSALCSSWEAGIAFWLGQKQRVKILTKRCIGSRLRWWRARERNVFIGLLQRAAPGADASGIFAADRGPDMRATETWVNQIIWPPFV